MADDRPYFTPEQVEEQVAWLRRQPPAQRADLRERQLVEDVQRLYQREIADERSLQAVRARLERQGAVARRPRQSHPPSPMRAGPSTPRPRRSLAARFVALAAAVLLIVVVAGLVAGLVLVSRHPNLAGQSTATVGATPTLAPAPPTVYGVSHENSIVALDPTTGATRWQQTFPDVTHLVLLAVQDQTIYVDKYNQNKQTETLSALSVRDGSQRWQIPSFTAQRITITKTMIITAVDATIQTWKAQTGAKGWTFQGPPIGTQFEGLQANDAAETLYATGFDNQSSSVTYAINLTTGQERWHLRDVRLVAAIGQSVYVTSPSGQLFTALNASDGTERWHIQADPNENSWLEPAVLNGVVYLSEVGYIQGGGGQGVLYALQESDGKELWHTPPSQDSPVYSEATLSQNTAYVSDAKGVYAFNVQDGQQRWHTRSGGFTSNIEQPILADGLVFMMWNGASTTPGNLTDFLTVLDANTGAERWHYLAADYTPQGPAGVEPPLVGDGVVFLYTEWNSLAQGIQALRASDGAPLWQKDYLTAIIVA